MWVPVIGTGTPRSEIVLSYYSFLPAVKFLPKSFTFLGVYERLNYVTPWKLIQTIILAPLLEPLKQRPKNMVSILRMILITNLLLSPQQTKTKNNYKIETSKSTVEDNQLPPLQMKILEVHQAILIMTAIMIVALTTMLFLTAEWQALRANIVDQ